MAMPEGTIKWFNPQKKYGFIVQEDGRDVFFHVSSVVGDERLYEGDRVTFQVEEDARGPKAADVRKLQEE
jgi:CspA family cold shock protein